MGRDKFWPLATTAAMALATGHGAWAQQAGAPAAKGLDDTLSEIIVTASRREQRLQDVPVAVTALSSESLDRLNVRSTQDLMSVVPGLQVSTQTAGDGGGSATFFLRGMGQQRSGNGSEPAVGVYVDDFYYPSLSGTLFKIVDLERVEVLRGPQGTLFGRNTIGGAIRYTTRNAKLGAFDGHLAATAGNYQRYDLSGAVNVPLGQRAALRLSGGHLEQDGYVRRQTDGSRAGGTTTDLIRGQAHIEPTEDSWIDVSGQWSRDELDGFAYRIPGPISPRPATVPFIYNIAVAPALGLPLYTDSLKSRCFYCQPGTDAPEFSQTTNKNFLVTAGWRIAEGFTLKSLTGWQDIYNKQSFDLDGTIASIFGRGVRPAQTYAFSQELQLNGQMLDGRLNFVAGGFYFNQRQPIRNLIAPFYVLGAPAPPAPVEDRDTKSYAGFVDGSLRVTDKLSLLGGFRLSEDHKSVLAQDPITKATLATAADKFRSSTFHAGLQYQWRPDVMTYASLSTGFRGGGFNPYDPLQLPQLQPFAPEKSTSYEVGARMQFLDRRVTINPTAFYVDWTNIQVQQVVLSNPVLNQGSVILQNAGKARSYGFELEWSAQAGDHLRLFGNFAWLDIRYTDIGKASGITLKSDLQRAPPVTYSVGAAHTLDLASGKVVTTLNYAFEDDQRSTPTDSDALLLPSYGLLGGRIDYTPAGAAYTIGLFGTNLLAKHYYVGGVDYSGNVGTAHYDVGRPREFGVSARVNF